MGNLHPSRISSSPLAAELRCSSSSFPGSSGVLSTILTGAGGLRARTVGACELGKLNRAGSSSLESPGERSSAVAERREEERERTELTLLRRPGRASSRAARPRKPTSAEKLEGELPWNMAGESESEIVENRFNVLSPLTSSRRAVSGQAYVHTVAREDGSSMKSSLLVATGSLVVRSPSHALQHSSCSVPRAVKS